MFFKKLISTVLCLALAIMSSSVVFAETTNPNSENGELLLPESNSYEVQIDGGINKETLLVEPYDLVSPQRIYSGTTLIQNYISGHFTPSYPANGGYDTISGKYIKQVRVTAWSIFNNSTKWTLVATSKTDTSRYETYYTKNESGKYTRTDSYEARSALGWDSGLEWEWFYF